MDSCRVQAFVGCPTKVNAKPVAALIKSNRVEYRLTPSQKRYLRAKGDRRPPDYRIRMNYYYRCLLCESRPYEGLRGGMKKHLIKEHGLTRDEARVGLNIGNVKDLRGIGND